MTAYKLVTQDYKTRAGLPNETSWCPGERVTAQGNRTEPCTDGVIHTYSSPAVAAFMNPVHAAIRNPRCLVVGTEVLGSDGTKQWGRWAEWTGEEVPLPEITTERRVEIAIRCSLTCRQDKAYRAWAEGWLSGADRTATAAAEARSAAAEAARSAAEAAEAFDLDAIIAQVLR
jgi:hypothetical protein